MKSFLFVPIGFNIINMIVYEHYQSWKGETKAFVIIICTVFVLLNHYYRLMYIIGLCIDCILYCCYLHNTGVYICLLSFFFLNHYDFQLYLNEKWQHTDWIEILASKSRGNSVFSFRLCHFGWRTIIGSCILKKGLIRRTKSEAVIHQLIHSNAY